MLCGGNCAVWSSGVPMLRARIDRGVNLRPWTVTSGWSAGGGFAVCAQAELTLAPKTTAAVIKLIQNDAREEAIRKDELPLALLIIFHTPTAKGTRSALLSAEHRYQM